MEPPAQEHVPLRLRHPLAGRVGDLLAQFADGELAPQQLDEPAQLGIGRIELEDLLPGRPGQRPGRRDQIDQLAWIGQPVGSRGGVCCSTVVISSQAWPPRDARCVTPADVDIHSSELKFLRLRRDELSRSARSEHAKLPFSLS